MNRHVTLNELEFNRLKEMLTYSKHLVSDVVIGDTVITYTFFSLAHGMNMYIRAVKE